MATDPRADDLEERLVQFAIDMVKLAGRMPGSVSARHIAAQMLRSGTAAAPNYGEARAAESRADFIHKLRIALKELNETAIWLRIIRGSFAVDADCLSRLIAENTELCKILVASIQTARRNSEASRRVHKGPIG
jgi:four helix bundle protein